MNTTLFYFSGRGNALNAARIIAGKLGDTQLVPIYKALNEKVDLSAERIGFAFQVIDLGMPSGTMLQVRNRFKAKGFKLSAGFFYYPMENRKRKPVWLHKCQQCGACFNLCPKKALHGKNLAAKTYHMNPYVELNDFISN